MSDILCHHEGRYNVYSTITDSFKFVGSLSFEALKTVIEKELGSRGLAALPAQLRRAQTTGVSSYLCSNLTECLDDNRAGPNETTLSIDECIDRFLS